MQRSISNEQEHIRSELRRTGLISFGLISLQFKRIVLYKQFEFGDIRINKRISSKECERKEVRWGYFRRCFAYNKLGPIMFVDESINQDEVLRTEELNRIVFQ